MSLDRWFRLFSYLTLGLSCVALVSAEGLFLPSLRICLAPVLALLLMSWWVEGRWTLPAWGANVLGLLIAGGGLTWLAMQWLDEDSFLARVPLHLGLVPYMGPLILAALLVKLFRPRQPGDFWWLQGLGLMQVGLGCVLAGGPEFGVLLAAYLAAGLTCLALHYRRPPAGPRQLARVSFEASAGVRQPIAGWRLLAFALRWTLLVSALALLLFLLTPRPDGMAWGPASGFRTRGNQAGSLQIGSGEGINLNGTGTVELDDEIAFQVAAADADGQERRDLPGDQRWRGIVLDWYENGRWRMPPPLQLNRRPPLRQHELPDFGPRQLVLTFTVHPRRSGGLVLAEPIRLGTPPTRLPVLPINPEGRSRLFAEAVGTVLPRSFSLREEYRYRQVLPDPADPGRTPADGLRKEGIYLDRLTQQPRRLQLHLQEWTVDLLRRLAKQPRYRLPEAVRSALARRWESFLIEPDHWEPVARVLTDYLATSGEFAYTLELTRDDRSLDPVLDFLINLKRGHCERFATALALMLRSLGVPSRLVKGFRGVDKLSEGTFAVRQYHAHAWVEILVPRRAGGPADFDWLTLDPTPAAPADLGSSFSLAQWWQSMQQNAGQMWHTLIVDYNADEQADLWESVKSGRRLSVPRQLALFVPAALIGILALLLLRRLLRRRRTVQPPIAAAFYHRLVRLLGRHTPLRPRTGQTPREFGAAARQILEAAPGLAAVAELPGRMIELFYRVRYGGRPLREPESDALDAEMERLTESLVLHSPNRPR